ncbi:low-affinity iron zinc ion transport fet4 [Fusarium beomiforme]|uniref:Low-affinity iron zinc ion transport fet4 n=1 Tax=Fusarium beomiforme TaxID=44412 RepID=A0A9P5E1K1_9HYPO|nr:low-affinity iron zinc ion transport fet4 [Fusarium beomiforme]
MKSILCALRQPGAIEDVVVAAPSHLPDPETHLLEPLHLIQKAPGYAPAVKPRFLDRALDRIVQWTGSIPMFVLLQVLVLVWSLSGIWVANTNLWPVLMGNFQAIFSYVLDSLLMRQQLNGYDENILVAAEVLSRTETHHRTLKLVVDSIGADKVGRIAADACTAQFEGEIRLPQQGRFDRAINRMALWLGHIWFVVFFWATMLLWLAFGPSNQWSDLWQLDINSATSALLIFIFSFLAILRERHAAYTHACVDAIYRVDAALEVKLRALTNDEIVNPETLMSAPRVSWLQRAINYYANVVGTLAGVALLIVVTIAWIAVGPVMHFSTNWWLLIGTYAGLVGLNDGFVMRNVQAQLRKYEAPHYAAIDKKDRELLAAVNIEPLTCEPINTTRISYRVSEWMNDVCGHEWTVLGGFIFLCGVVAGSSAMHWNETGQLLSNIPPMIIESFFMIILITGHNSADAERRIYLTDMFRRRLQLLDFANHVTKEDDADKIMLNSIPDDVLSEVIIRKA